MPQAILYLTAFAVGGVVTTYLTVNSLTTEKVDSELLANLAYFLLAAAVTLLILVVQDGGAETLTRFRSLPWYGWLTGIAAAAALFYTTKLIGDIGPDKFFVASVAGQLTISVFITHMGWLGTEQEAINWQKVGGVLLAVTGAVLVSFRFGE